MITAIRNLFSSTLGKVIALAFIGLIGVLFALSDVGNTGFGGGMGDTAVADVGDEQVSIGELRQSINQAYDRARQQQPGLTREAFVAEAFDPILDDVIQGAAFRQFARQLGFGVSERQIDGQIADAFAGVSGSFDETRYKAYLRDTGTSEIQLRRNFETLLLMQQLAQPAGTTPRTGNGMALPYAALLVEERRGQATFIPASRFAPAADPGDAVLQKHLKDNRSLFSIPERRILQYAVFDRSVAPVAAVTDKEVADIYKANAARFAASETRRFMQVIAQDQAAANAIAAKVRAGTPLAAAAQAAGLTAAPSGDVTQTAYSGLTNAAAAKAAFAAKRGDILGPTQTGLGWTIAQVETITATPAKTLADATPEIRAQLQKSKAEEAIISFYNGVQDAVNEGVSIDEITTDRKLTLVETPALLPSGRAPAQPAFALAADLAPMISQAFQGSDAGETHLATLVENEKFAVYAIKSVVPAAPPPFAQIRADLLADWKLAQGQKVARDKARAIVKAVEGKQSFADAVRAAGPNIGNVQTIGGLRAELGAGGQRVPPELALLFSMAQGSVKTLEIPGNRGWMVIALGKVERPNPKDIQPERVAAIAGPLGPAFGNELVAQMMQDARKRVGVKLNQKLIDQLRKELTGDAPVAE